MQRNCHDMQGNWKGPLPTNYIASDADQVPHDLHSSQAPEGDLWKPTVAKACEQWRVMRQLTQFSIFRAHMHLAGATHLVSLLVLLVLRVDLEDVQRDLGIVAIALLQRHLAHKNHVFYTCINKSMLIHNRYAKWVTDKGEEPLQQHTVSSLLLASSLCNQMDEIAHEEQGILVATSSKAFQGGCGSGHLVSNLVLRLHQVQLLGHRLEAQLVQLRVLQLATPCDLRANQS